MGLSGGECKLPGKASLILGFFDGIADGTPAGFDLWPHQTRDGEADDNKVDQCVKVGESSGFESSDSIDGTRSAHQGQNYRDPERYPVSSQQERTYEKEDTALHGRS